MEASSDSSYCSDQNSSEKETLSEVLDVPVTKNVAQQVQKMESKGLLERRVSPRLKNIPEDKRPYYGSDRMRQLCAPKDDVCNIVTVDNDRKRPLDFPKHNAGSKKAKGECDLALCPPQYDDMEIVHLEDGGYLKWTDYKSFIADSDCNRATTWIREKLRIFNKHYLSVDQKGGAKRSYMQLDLKAITEMLNKKEILYAEKQFGHLPGIFVGHTFLSRAEMVAVGFRGHWFKGIDYIGKLCGKLRKQGNSSLLAVAVVLCGQYEGDVDCLNEVVYNGQGGNDLLGKKRQIKDQVMLRGNLALKNNMEQCVPVRVIRVHKFADDRKVYIYSGMYKVVNGCDAKGVSGLTVFKYRLKRLLGQPKVNTYQVNFERERASKAFDNLPGLVCEDISQGEEKKRIPVTNMIDWPPIPPAGFEYTKSIEVARNVPNPPSATGCNCKGSCINPKSCSCARLNGFDFPYVNKDGGRLIEPKDVVFECGPGCGCGPDCINRTSQRGLKYQLEVFRTKNKGWAVRSWDFIPSGAPVCEYTGILKRNNELDNVSENDYIFEIDCWHTINEIGGRERRQGDVSLPASNPVEKIDDTVAEREPEFCMDAGSCGNVTRFINHSCEPNLFVQCVLSSHHDIRLARIVLFAADDIPPMQELTYDYGYELDSVIGADGKLKQMPCHCGASECRGRLY